MGESWGGGGCGLGDYLVGVSMCALLLFDLIESFGRWIQAAGCKEG